MQILDDTAISVRDRFAAIADIAASIDEYRFVGETGLLIETMLGAVQRAATNLLLCDSSLDTTVKARIESLATAPKSVDSYEALAAVCALKELKLAEFPDPRSPHGITQRLVDVVWHYTFMHYFWVKRQREAQTQ